MNHLAHLLLSGDDPELRTGGFLGDFVRGRLGGRFPAGIEDGIRLHRFVDARTDGHPLFREAVGLFPAGQRRWAPVALDVWFDHLLARDFATHGPEPLEAFAARACADLDAHAVHMEPAPRRFLARLREGRLLERYAERETVSAVLARLATRTERSRALLELDESLDPVAADLEALFPALLGYLREATGGWHEERAGR